MEPEEQAKICLADINDYVVEMLVSLPSDNQEYIGVKDSGDTVLELCSKSEGLLGNADIRQLGPGGFESCLSDFLKKVGSFDKDINGGKLTFCLKRAEKKFALLLSLLNMPWNTEKPPPVENNDNREVNSTPPPPPPAAVKPVLKRMTPLKGTMEYPCPDCPIVFTSVTSYKRHLKDKHEKVDKDTKAAKVTCMLERGGKRCGAKYTLADYYRHLRNGHKEIVIPDKASKKTLRFFKSSDGGKTFSDVVFMQSTDQDPSPDDVTYFDEEPEGARGNENNEELGGSLDNDDEEELEGIQNDDNNEELDRGSNNDLEFLENGVDVKNHEQEPHNDDDGEVIVDSEQEGNHNSQVDFLNIGSEVELVDEGNNNNDEVVNYEVGIQADLSSEAEELNNNEGEDHVMEIVVEQDLQGNLTISPNKSIPETDANIEPEKEKPKKVAAVFVDASQDVFIDLHNFREFDDSLLHSSDEEDFTVARLANKKKRYSQRDITTVEGEMLWKSEGNAEFIEKMDTYMKTVKYSTNANKKLTHVSATHRLLFTDPDSWLQHMTSKKPDFKLRNMLLFSSTTLEQFPNPIPWINEIAGPSGTDKPGERKERLKCFARLRSFLDYEIDNYEFNINSESNRQLLKKRLTDNEAMIKREKLWSKLDTLIAAEARDKKLALQIQNPSHDKNTVNAVKTWFASDKHKELLDKHNNNWDQAVAIEMISETAFTEFALWTRFITMLLDRNRSANYKFSNTNFICALKCWYPPDFSPESNQQVPDDWNIHQAPGDGRKHDALQIKLSGKQSGLKGQIGTTITIQGLALTLCTKYRDLKKIVHPQADPDASFFVNYSGGDLAELSNTRGSLLDIFGKTVGIQNATVTKIRKGLDTKFQNSDISRKRALTNAIVNHSDEVSAAHYDLEGADARSKFMYALSQTEGGHDDDEKEDVNEEIEAKRARLEEEDRIVREKFVSQTLQKSRKSKLTLGKNQKIHTEDRNFLQRIFSMKEYHGFHNIRLLSPFPGFKDWRRIFYRIVDSDDLSDEDQQKLREVERRIFDELKDEIVKASDEESWIGSRDQNKKADQIIANKIRTSFRTYEKSKDAHNVYFTFN